MIHWQVIDWNAAPAFPEGAVLALGTFDGVHRGHQAILARAQVLAREMQTPAAVLTFDRHPLAVLRGRSPELLTTLPEKLKLFEQLGMDGAVVLQFDRELAELPAAAFVDQVLIAGLRLRGVVVGFNFTYGRRAEGSASCLRQQGTDRGLRVEVVSPVSVNGWNVSSSAIRQLLGQGNVEEAALLLGHPYTVYGHVVAGDRRGRELGIPTANLALPDEKLLPADGVYAGRASIFTGQTARVSGWPAVMSISDKPTFRAHVGTGAADTVPRVLEVHLLDFDGDVYGQNLQVSFDRYLRPILRFPDVDSLKARMLADIDEAREVNKRLHPRDRMVE